MSDVLKAALRESPVLMAVLDNNLVCRELSPTWRDLLSIARDIPIALEAGELFDAVDQVRVTARIRFTVSDGRAIRGLMGTLNTASRPLPVRFWAWRTTEPADGTTWTVLTAVETIRPQVGGEARMHTMHQQILEAAGEGITGVDDLGRITFVNAKALAMLGGKTEELISQPLHDMVHHSRADGTPYPREDSPIRAAYKEGESCQVDDEVFWRMDGSSVAVEYTCTPVWNKERLAGAVVIFKDSSQKRQLESEQYQARTEIEQLRQSLDLERSLAAEQVAHRAGDNEPVTTTQSRAMRRTIEQLQAIAVTDTNVLLIGERGVGKATLAETIHKHSNRHTKPLVTVPCARHEQAQAQLFGLAESQDSGDHAHLQVPSDATLILEEVGALPPPQQQALLVALEHDTGASVRVIATSSHCLENEVQAGRFNETLYDRLSVFSVQVPPLRERPEDIAPLAQHLLKNICEKLGRQEPPLTRQQLSQLRTHGWSGNVQELCSVLEHALTVSGTSRLRLDLALPTAHTERPMMQTPLGLSQQRIHTEDELREMERSNMVTALRQCKGRVSGPNGAAVLLGLKPSTLAYRMKHFGIDKEDIRPPRTRLSDYPNRVSTTLSPVY